MRRALKTWGRVLQFSMEEKIRPTGLFCRVVALDASRYESQNVNHFKDTQDARQRNSRTPIGQVKDDRTKWTNHRRKVDTM
jgi:hypothetical protein